VVQNAAPVLTHGYSHIFKFSVIGQSILDPLASCSRHLHTPPKGRYFRGNESGVARRPCADHRFLGDSPSRARSRVYTSTPTECRQKPEFYVSEAARVPLIQSTLNIARNPGRSLFRLPALFPSHPYTVGSSTAPIPCVCPPPTRKTPLPCSTSVLPDNVLLYFWQRLAVQSRACVVVSPWHAVTALLKVFLSLSMRFEIPSCAAAWRASSLRTHQNV